MYIPNSNKVTLRKDVNLQMVLKVKIIFF